MGEYISLEIGGYSYLTRKNSFGDLLLFFTEKDLKIDSEMLDGEEYKTFCFSTTVEKAIKCLDCLGHSMSKAKEDFERDKSDKIEFAQYVDDRAYEMELNEQYNFENWVSAAQKYALLLSSDRYDWKANSYTLLEKARHQAQTISEKIVLESLPFGESFFGLDCSNVNAWNIFRAILEIFEPRTLIKLDYSNLFYGGWCNEFPEPEDYSVAKTIILTEGKYDAEIISNSIRILYPYMTKFYSFINFSDYKVQGSTSFLTHYFKAFIASGIQNRIIALYDNDSAGLAELIDLEKMVFPDNFRAMHLPDIELTSDYPTLGPNGNENMNINGKACSIEMFLGQDILRENGEFIPVHWRGFVEKTKTYQGEIMNKGRVQEKFDKKVAKALADGTIDEAQWKEMNVLLNTIFSAFLE